MRNLSKQTALCVSVLLSTTPVMAQNQLELILDGHAYGVNSNVTSNLANKTITVTDSEATNCLRPGNLTPLNNAGNFTLLTNNQAIGIVQSRYWVKNKLLFLTSETSNLICNNGIFVDRIFKEGFGEFISPFLIFADGFD